MLPYKGWIEKRGKRYRARVRLSGSSRTISATFAKKELAAAWLFDYSTRAVQLTPAQSEDAFRALEILPKGVKLVEAAEFYVLRFGDGGDLDAEPIIDSYLESKAHLRTRTLAEYRQDLRRIMAIEPSFSRWTAEAVEGWLRELTPAKRNHMLSTLRAFFAWAVEAGHVKASPVERLKPVKVDAPRRAVLSIDEAQRLLAAAERIEPRALHYLALCLFAGLRPEECARLRPRNLSSEYVVLDEGLTKTHSARTVPIAPNLAAFLARCPLPKGGPAFYQSGSRLRAALRTVIEAAGITWSPDVMRHSYASYEYERTRDAATTASNLGHTTTNMLFKHYRGLVEPGTGSAYFSITIPTPEALCSN